MDKGKMKLGLLTRSQTGEQDQGLSLAEGLHHNQERKTREPQVVSVSHLDLLREDPGVQVMKEEAALTARQAIRLLRQDHLYLLLTWRRRVEKGEMSKKQSSDWMNEVKKRLVVADRLGLAFLR